MNTRTACIGMLSVSFAALLSAAMATSATAQPAAAIRIVPNDIGGVVTGAKGPEAGVWVIAETADLPTKFVKIVVTDDQGRYVLPDLPKANYDIWVPRLWPCRFTQGESAAGQGSRPQSRAGAQPRRGRRVLSGHLLVFDAEYPARQFVPRHRPARQRHARDVEGSGPVAALRQDRRLHPLPSARRSGDAHHSRGSSAISTPAPTHGSDACNRARPAPA